MQVGQFPASAANSLIQGYCDDFVSLAAILAQTLEQISMRGIAIDRSRPALTRIEGGMRNLAEAIHELLERGKVTTELGAVINKEEPAPVTATPSPPSSAKAAATATPAAPAPVATAPKAKYTAAPPAPPPTTPIPREAPAATATPTRSAEKPAMKAAPTPAPRPTAPKPSPQTTVRATAGNPSAPAAAATNRLAKHTSQEGLKGNAQSMPLLSVFQFLGRMRKQGTMHVQAHDEQIAFDLVNGSITATSTDRCPRQERLGELLVELGHCTREQVDAIAARVDAGTFERFGEVAIEMGFARAEHIADALQQQVRVRFARACKSPDVAYEFVEGACQAAAGIFRFPPVAIA